MVKFVNIRELKNRTSAVVRRAGKGDVIVTSRGKPKVVLHAITEDELEDYLLAHAPKFLRSLETSYRAYQQRGGVSLDRLIAETERELAQLRR